MIGNDMNENKDEYTEVEIIEEIDAEEIAADEYEEVEVIEEIEDSEYIELEGIEVEDAETGKEYGSDGDLQNPKSSKKIWAIRIAAIVVPIIAVGALIYCGIKFITKATDYAEAEKLVVVFEDDAEKPIPEPIVIPASTPDVNLAESIAAAQEQVTIQRHEYNYSSLSAQAPQAAGYLNVLNTNIQYPVMWSEDDDYYLTHSSDGNANGNGAIFLTSSNNPDFSDSTNYIFGHNMTNGLMFRSINNYISGGVTNYTYLNSHNAAYLVTPYETETYYLFYAEVIDPDADEYVTTGTKADISARAGVDIPEDAKMLILVTCYTQNNSKRVLVYGYKI